MVTFSDRLNSMLFLEFNKEKLSDLLGIPEIKKTEGDLYLPVNPEFLIHEIKESNPLENLPVTEFINGMAYTLGIDPDFRYGAQYRLILNSGENPGMTVKAKAHDLMKSKRNEEAFILLLGLYEASGDEDIENALLMLGEELTLKDKAYSDNVLEIADKAIDNGNNYGNLIKGSIMRILGKDTEALLLFRTYIENGGEETDELSSEMEKLDRDGKLTEGYEMITDNPDGALKKLLPFYDSEMGNSRYLYSIAVAYRNLKNHDKAIYYLEEAMANDPGYSDIVNELGINYSMVGEDNKAQEYFRKVYEATGDIGPLTNLVISLFKTGNTEEAVRYFNEAERKAPDDEILKEIRKFYM